MPKQCPLNEFSGATRLCSPQRLNNLRLVASFQRLDAGEKDDSLQSRKLEPALAIPEPVSLVQNGKLDLDQSISTSVYDMDIDWVSLHISGLR